LIRRRIESNFETAAELGST